MTEKIGRNKMKYEIFYGSLEYWAIFLKIVILTPEN